MNKNKPSSPSFTFIDLFAGIGGIRAGFESFGGKCVFTSEWNEQSQKTYQANFHDDHEISGDITKVRAEDIPDHNVLLAGFPCQPFSIAGVSKKNALGRPHGFKCQTQGTLFFDVARIIETKRPEAFLLENVKNLVSHDGGNTFRVIRETLEQELGYRVFTKVIDARHFVPQHRERIIIVGFREDTGFSWDQLSLPENQPLLGSILHSQKGTDAAEEPYTIGEKAKVNSKYILSDKLWVYLQNYAAKHRAKGNGFGFGLVGPKDVARTLSARYYKDGSEILIDRGKGKNPRRLTPRECARLMGYPDTFRIPVSDTQAYRQFGNSVALPVIKAVAEIMVPHVLNLMEEARLPYQTILCSTGNPDHEQYAPVSTTARVRSASLEEASKACRDYIKSWNLGAGNWGGDAGKVYRNDMQVATIAYNGKIILHGDDEVASLCVNG